MGSRPLGTSVRIYDAFEGGKVGRAETFSAQASFFQTPLVGPDASHIYLLPLSQWSTSCVLLKAICLGAYLSL